MQAEIGTALMPFQYKLAKTLGNIAGEKFYKQQLMSLKETYIQYGVPSNWAHEYELIGISASTFKKLSDSCTFVSK